MPFSVYLRDRDGNECLYALGFGLPMTIVPLIGPTPDALTGSGNYKALSPDGKVRIRRVLWDIFGAFHLGADYPNMAGVRIYGEQLTFANADSPWGLGFVLGGAFFAWHTAPQESHKDLGVYLGGLLERQIGNTGPVFRVELSAMIGVKGSVVLYPSVGLLWLFRE